jgi:23S rRNA pseudouridine1911/1915/1917 synthase
MNQLLRFHIEEGDARQRLDQYLASRLIQLSRMRIANLILQGGCLVNQAARHSGYQLRAGDIVEVTFDSRLPSSMHPEDLPLDILYEDDQLLVVVKPSGILVHPSLSIKTGTLANALTYHLNRNYFNTGIQPDIYSPTPTSLSIVRPGIVHRLDRATSGLMVIAKTQRALSILSTHFHKRLINKRYLALVHGEPVEDEYTIETMIGKDPDNQPHWRVMDHGKPAETKLKVLKRCKEMSLVEMEPVTGRTNQLRIHSAHIGHTIVGDRLYGSNIESRLCLHASKLAFHHPSNGEWIEFTSPLPSEIKDLFTLEESKTMSRPEPKEDNQSEDLKEVVRKEQEYVRQRLADELQREPSEEEINEWLRQHTESY